MNEWWIDVNVEFLEMDANNESGMHCHRCKYGIINMESKFKIYEFWKQDSIVIDVNTESKFHI